MPLRRSKPLRLSPQGLSDAIDGSNAFPGAMSALTNLIPAPHTKNLWVPRPASLQATAFGGYTGPAQVTALLSVGNFVGGMIAETGGAFAGKDVPFVYNATTGAFLTITGITAGSLPTTQSASGDWAPPVIAVVGTRAIFTHPGFPGGSIKFGWLDFSGFTSNNITGSTHGTTTLDTLSSNVLQAGWNVGMAISSSAGDIPAGTTIVSIASNGLSVTLSQAASGSHAGATLTVAGGTVTSPQWASGDCNGNALASVPVSVTQFSGRAYFAVGAGVAYSDSGNATQRTNGSQALTFNNGIPVTALAGLPLSSTTYGGIIQSVIAIQGNANMIQISGDQATSNLATNNLGVGVGTLAPNTICPTPLGVAMVSPDGVRIINFLAQVSEPLGAHGGGVTVPFISAVNPSRMCAAYNQDTLRISVQNGAKNGQPWEEYWYNFSLKTWSGPHDFPASLIQPDYGASGGFILAPQGVTGKLFTSQAIPSLSDTYVENGSQMTWTLQTVLLPDTGEMAEHAVIETTLSAVIANNQTIQILALDEAGNTLGTLTLPGGAIAPSYWGNFNWGSGVWGSATPNLYQHPLAWPAPLVFKQMSIRITGNAAMGAVLGGLNLRYQILGYLTQAME